MTLRHENSAAGSVGSKNFAFEPSLHPGEQLHKSSGAKRCAETCNETVAMS